MRSCFACSTLASWVECRQCAWLCASWSVKTRLHWLTSQHVWWTLLLLTEPSLHFTVLVQAAPSTSSAASPSLLECPSRGPVEGFLLPMYSFRASLLLPSHLPHCFRDLPRSGPHHTLLSCSCSPVPRPRDAGFPSQCGGSDAGLSSSNCLPVKVEDGVASAIESVALALMKPQLSLHHRKTSDCP